MMIPRPGFIAFPSPPRERIDITSIPTARSFECLEYQWGGIHLAGTRGGLRVRRMGRRLVRGMAGHRRGGGRDGERILRRAHGLGVNSPLQW